MHLVIDSMSQILMCEDISIHKIKICRKGVSKESDYVRQSFGHALDTCLIICEEMENINRVCIWLCF